jgi:RNA polymerase sigma-70 factor (ECF subfamily)
MSTPCSQSVLQRIAAGDSSAVEDCLDRYGDLVWSIARRFFANAADAEDMVQEIFVAIWRNAPRYAPERSSESTFISMLARRKLIDRLRRRSASLETTPLGDASAVIPQDVEPDPLELADDFQKAADCFKRLESSQRLVLESSIHRGLSYSRIAESLGVPLGTVKSQARRGILALRDCFRANAVLESSGVSA